MTAPAHARLAVSVVSISPFRLIRSRRRSIGWRCARVYSSGLVTACGSVTASGFITKVSFTFFDVAGLPFFIGMDFALPFFAAD